MAEAGQSQDIGQAVSAPVKLADLFSGVVPKGDPGRTVAWLGGYVAAITTGGLLYLGASAVEVLGFLAAMTLGGLALLISMMTQTRRIAAAQPKGRNAWIRKPVAEGLEDRLFREAKSRPRTPEPRATLVLSPLSHVARNLQDGVTAMNRNALSLSDPKLAIDWLVENPDFFDVLLLDADGLGMPRTIEFLRDVLIVDPELPVIALTRHSRDLETYALRGFRQVTLADTGSLTRLALGGVIDAALERDLRRIDQTAMGGPDTASPIRFPGRHLRVIPGGAAQTERMPVLDDAGNR